MLLTADIQEDTLARAVRLNVTLCDYQLGNIATEKHLEDLVLTIPPSALTTTRFDPAIINVKLSAAAGAEATTGTTWQSTEVHGGEGWKWSSLADALPTDPKDARIFDQDADGNPGVTLTFTGHSAGSVYLAMDFRWMFSGTMSANADLVGATIKTRSDALSAH
jgi:hypothetical protein